MDFTRVAGAQLNLVVGDIKGNTARILEAMEWAEDCQADVVLFPELAITVRNGRSGVFRVDASGTSVDWIEVRPGIQDGDRVVVFALPSATGAVEKLFA